MGARRHRHAPRLTGDGRRPPPGSILGMTDADLPPLDLAAHRAFLENALEEDHARHDVTATAIVPAEARGVADVLARSTGVLAGVALAAEVFRLLDPEAAVECLAADGDLVGEGTTVLTVRGNARAILSAERTALNLLGRLGGIATLTHRFVEATMGTGVHVLDTRKTTPGMRHLEKYAVACGGGTPHRMDLEDAAMIKENHLYAAFGATGEASIREGIRRCRAALPAGKTLYVEVEDLNELDAAVEEGADVVMLDGFDLGRIREAVHRLRGRDAPRPALEITGGVRLDTIAALASAGAQRISSGALTHSAPGMDLSLRMRGA